MIVVPGGPAWSAPAPMAERALAAPARRRHAPHLQRLHRRLPAGLRRPARRPRRHHALALGRPAAPAVPRCGWRTTASTWTAAVLDLGRRLGRHRPGPGSDRARPRSRTVAAGGAPAGGLHAPRRRPAPVQPDPAAAGPRRRAVPRAGAEDGGATVGPLVDRRHGRRLRHVAPHLQRKFIAHFGVAPTEVLRMLRRARRRRAGDRQDVEGNGRHLGPMG